MGVAEQHHYSGYRLAGTGAEGGQDYRTDGPHRRRTATAALQRSHSLRAQPQPYNVTVAAQLRYWTLISARRRPYP
jgi:hypothetical protein